MVPFSWPNLRWLPANYNQCDVRFLTLVWRESRAQRITVSAPAMTLNVR